MADMDVLHPKLPREAGMASHNLAEGANSSSSLVLARSPDDREFWESELRKRIDRFVSKAHLAVDSVAVYRFAATAFMKFCGPRPWESANAALTAWAHELAQGKLRANTIALYVAAARAWVKDLGHDPGEVKLPRKPRGFLRDPLTPEEFRKLLDAYAGDDIKAVRNRALVALMGVTGVRGIEVHRANVEDLRDIGRPVLYVQRKGSREKDSFVVIPPALLEIIEHWLKARRDAARDPALFVSVSKLAGTYGQRLARSAIRWVVREGLERAGLRALGKRISPHSLRHTAGTTARREGAELTAVQKMLDHKNVQTTTIYDHALDRLKDAPEDAVAGALLRAKG